MAYHTIRVVDHRGNKFISERAMCSFWKASYREYKAKRFMGLPVSMALDPCVPSREPDIDATGCREKLWVDHLGNRFSDIAEMCKYWKISKNAFIERRSAGKSLKYTLETPYTPEITNSKSKIKVFDHLGNGFSSVKSMADFWGLSKNTLDYRMKHGMSLEDALTTHRNRGNKYSNGNKVSNETVLSMVRHENKNMNV